MKRTAHSIVSPYSGKLPKAVGIGLHREHISELFAGAVRASFVEIHAENYMSEGGPNLGILDAIAEIVPVSVHGVALSLGGEEALDRAHLERLRRIVDRIKPASFSEHLAWSSHDGVYFNDLLPVAYDSPTLTRVCNHVDETQNALGMQLLLENPSTYVAFETSTWDEVDFITEVAQRSGCGLLLDINNVVVSAFNHQGSAKDYLNRFPMSAVREVHLAGHEKTFDDDDQAILIDSHGDTVSETVWDLYSEFVDRHGAVATLIERDNNVPPISELNGEVMRAEAILRQYSQRLSGA